MGLPIPIIIAMLILIISEWVYTAAIGQRRPRGVGYFTIDTNTSNGLYRKDVLDELPAVEETPYVRHVRFDSALRIMMDGKKQEGVVLLPNS